MSVSESAIASTSDGKHESIVSESGVENSYNNIFHYK